MDKSKKNYIKIDVTTSTEEIFALLDNVNSDVEDDIDEVLNDSNTEFYVEEETYNSSATNSTQIEHNLLIPEANAHVLENTEEKQNTSKNQNNKKKNKANKEVISWKSNDRPFRREPCILHPEVKHEFPQNHTLSSTFEKVFNLNILVELFVNEANIYAQQCGRNFYTTSDEMKPFLGVNFFMAINKNAEYFSFLGLE